MTRSIGEGVVPNKDKIQSVLNSVRRQYSIKEQDFETPDTVVDDILVRVLANEFLDAKRREELSEKLLAVKNEKKAEQQGASPVSPTAPTLEKDQLVAVFVSIAAAMTGAVVFLILDIIRRRGHQDLRVVDPREVARFTLISTFALVTVVLVAWLTFTVASKEGLSIQFRHSPTEGNLTTTPPSSR